MASIFLEIGLLCTTLIIAVHSSCVVPHKIGRIDSIDATDVTQNDIIIGADPSNYDDKRDELCLDANAKVFADGRAVVPEIELPNDDSDITAGQIQYFATYPTYGPVRRYVLWGFWCTAEPSFALTLRNPTARRYQLQMDAYYEPSQVDQHDEQDDDGPSSSSSTANSSDD